MTSQPIGIMSLVTSNPRLHADDHNLRLYAERKFGNGERIWGVNLRRACAPKSPAMETI